MDVVMEDESQNVDNCTEPFGTWYFENIPVEILLHICSFLDAKFIYETLRNVCNRFHDILSDECIWKTRLSKRCKKGQSYPAIPVKSDDYDWQYACIEVESQHDFWSTINLKRHLLQNIHIATVDAIHLMKDGAVCVSGSRDRSIVVWNVTHLKDNQEPVYEMYSKAHQGWIWNFASLDDKLYSCSWDKRIRCWSLGDTLLESASFMCDNPVLTVAIDGNALAAGLYASKIILFDVRQSNPVCQYSPHRLAVLNLTMDSYYIISASEDNTVAVWDQRAGKIYKQNLLLQEKIDTKEVLQGRGFPMCLSYKNDHLYVGDSKGFLHLIDASHGKFNFVKTYDVGHSRKLTAVQHDYGYLITSSLDGTIRVFTPMSEPELIVTVESQGGEVTKFDYKNNILAFSGTNNAVELMTR